MNIVEEQYKKLLHSVNKFEEDLKRGDKRAAIGDMDFIQDRAKGIIYLLLAQLEDERKVSEEDDCRNIVIERLSEDLGDGLDRSILFNDKKQ